VLKFLGSVHKYNFYENEKHGTFAVYKNNKPIAYPTTIEQVLLKMEQVGKKSHRWKILPLVFLLIYISRNAEKMR